MPNDLRKGYDPDFLGEGHSVPLPTLSIELSDDIVTRDELRDQHIADYVHYSVVMSRSNRQAFFSAANLDQDDYKSVEGRSWFVDPRIGAENQVGPVAYRDNPWDRGHLTRRTAVTWGSSFIARRASNDSCSYANASMQHAYFNQDEWRVPEKIVRHFDRDKNNKLIVFTGPIFMDHDRWYTRHNVPNPVRIPSGFWKMVVYISKETNKLECQAYAMYQDAHFLADKRGQYEIDIRNYQITTTELEKLTGLEFGQTLFDINPLLYYNAESSNDGRTNVGPEGFVAPRSTEDDDLDQGVIFNSEWRTTKKDLIKNINERLTSMTEEQLLDVIRGIGVTPPPPNSANNKP